MTSTIRPVAALLLAAGTTLAHAADTFSSDNAVASYSAVSGPVGLASAGADSDPMPRAARGVRSDRSAVLAALDFLRAGEWTVGAGDARVDGGLFDNDAAGVRRHVGYRHALGPVEVDATLSYINYPTLSGAPGSRGASYLGFGMRHDLGHAISVMVHAGEGRMPGGSWDWRDLKAGLNRKLDGGWLLALNYTRAYGAIGASDRFALATGRADPRPAFLSAGRRALVLSATRRF
jgi:hypothetical protein